MPNPLRCPCGQPAPYSECCSRFHAGAVAPDAPSLMRSRYSAYVLANANYLLATWHLSTRPPNLEFPPTLRWLGLTIKSHEQIDSDHASVEFIARSRLGGGSVQRLHERSSFVREEGRWFYVDGEFLAK